MTCYNAGMLFKKQEFTVRITGDDLVGVPFKDAEQALAAIEVRAAIDAKLREWLDVREIVPWIEE